MAAYSFAKQVIEVTKNYKRKKMEKFIMLMKKFGAQRCKNKCKILK